MEIGEEALYGGLSACGKGEEVIKDEKGVEREGNKEEEALSGQTGNQKENAYENKVPRVTIEELPAEAEGVANGARGRLLHNGNESRLKTWLSTGRF